MTPRLFNTLSRRKEALEPIEPGHVRLYVCGPTVYDRAHIGNARPVVVFDTLVRLLRRLYPRVTYVRNITDVDDKINAKAQASGRPIAEITAETTRLYHEDMAALGAAPPDHEPRATAYIGQMIAFIEALIEKGHAYAAEGHVLFAVGSFGAYGALSRRSRDEMIAGARVEVAPYKKDPADFVLWKPSTPDLPGWDSPWGRGRPGWHIECSAMAAALLGPEFDIHGGGADLIFPHHENEIAQSRCRHDGSGFARIWMHNGHLTVTGEKMSKSLGNVLIVRDLLTEAPGEAVRLALLSSHYHQPLAWDDETLKRAKARLDRWYRAIQGEADATDPPAEVVAALADDLNTPQAIALLDGYTNAAFHGEAGAAAKLKAGARLLGHLTADPEAWFRWTPSGQAGLADADIEALIADRAAARKSRDFARADAIRNDLRKAGVELEDGPAGTTWRRAG